MKYPKIETLWNRGDDFKVMPGDFRMPEFVLVKSWLITEKIDGRNHRVILNVDGTVEHRGRTDRAQFADFELEAAQRIIDDDLVRAAFDRGSQAVLYGELYGPKIQKGGVYGDEIQFRLFDVRVGDWWLNWRDVEDVAQKINVSTVPLIYEDEFLPTCKDELGDYFTDGSYVGGDRPEGIVARTDPLLFTRRGERLMWKLKFKDFK
jgi:hypothetical protein